METSERVDRIEPRLLEDEMRESFIDYSMSVIVQRALPDVRDGLKPVHRRILYAMQEAGLTPTRPYKKSATVVGDVLGKYHPHGDSAVYDSLVRMVQDFSLRYPLIDGQGNFGSVDGDSAAAYRYTEARLAPISLEMLTDIDRETVDFQPNFDDRLREPVVLPSRIPNLLVNGSSGIAVGMATNIPPHNLREIVAACVRVIDQPDCTLDELLEDVTGPDFPTGGFIYGRDGIVEAYESGRGRVVMRARAEIEEKERGGERIVVTEIPFMVNKTRLIEQIAQLVRDRRIEDISDLRDESDRDGIRLVIELKRDAIPYIVLNQLYKHTQMQSTFGVIMLALVDGVPRVMPLKEMLEHFLEHRHEVVVRRSEHDLGAAKDREHVLEGLKVAVDNIDEVIEIIRESRDAEAAGQRLRERFELTERQSEAILNMRLARLTGLEIEKLEEELEEGAHRRAREDPRFAKPSYDDREGGAHRPGREVRGRPAHRDRRREGRLYHAGPDRRGGHGDHGQPRRLREAHPTRRVPAAAERRTWNRRHEHEGGGLGGSCLPRLDARLSDDLHGRRSLLLAEGVRNPGGRSNRPRQADHQPRSAGPGRRDRLHRTSPGVPGRSVPHLRDQGWPGEEDQPGRVLKRPLERRERDQHRGRRSSDRRAAYRRNERCDSGHPRRHGDPVRRERCASDGAGHTGGQRHPALGG
jgi:hypothetical protein